MINIACARYVEFNLNKNKWGEGEFNSFMDNDKDFLIICTTGFEDYFGEVFN